MSAAAEFLRSSPPMTAQRLSEAARKLAPADFFRRNMFRLLQLPISADNVQVKRRSELILHALRRDLPVQPGPQPVLSRLPAPDQHEVSAAAHAFMDAPERFAHAFFWFRPLKTGDETADVALRSLAEGREEIAIEQWRSAVAKDGSDKHVAQHNLAIFYQLKALEIARSGAANEYAQRDKLVQSWIVALKYWSAIWSDAEFWRTIEGRLEVIADPMLPVAAAQQLRDALPVILGHTVAAIAVEKGEAGETTLASELLAKLRLHSAGWPSTAIEDGILIAIEPIRSLLRALHDATEKEADADVSHADRAVERLLERVKPKLDLLALLLPKTSQVPAAESDRIANACAANLTVFANKTENWKRTQELFRKLEPFACGEVTRRRVNDSKKTLEANIEGDFDETKCWFCSKNDADVNSAHSVAMYGEVKREWDRLRWKEVKVSVPRCKKCAVDDARLGAIGCGSVLVAALTAGAIIFGVGFKAGGMAAVIVGILAGAIVFGLLSVSIVGSRGARREQTEFPPIKKLRSAGWQFGLKPPEAT